MRLAAGKHVRELAADVGSRRLSAASRSPPGARPTRVPRDSRKTTRAPACRDKTLEAGHVRVAELRDFEVVPEQACPQVPHRDGLGLVQDAGHSPANPKFGRAHVAVSARERHRLVFPRRGNRGRLPDRGLERTQDAAADGGRQLFHQRLDCPRLQALPSPPWSPARACSEQWSSAALRRERSQRGFRASRSPADDTGCGGGKHGFEAPLTAQALEMNVGLVVLTKLVANDVALDLEDVFSSMPPMGSRSFAACSCSMTATFLYWPLDRERHRIVIGDGRRRGRP